MQVLEALNSYEPELLSCGSVSGGGGAGAGAGGAAGADGVARTLALLADLYDRELVGVISWAKQIPGFGDLQLNDQVCSSCFIKAW